MQELFNSASAAVALHCSLLSVVEHLKMEETCLSKIALTGTHQKGKGCLVLALYGDIRAKPMFLMPFSLAGRAEHFLLHERSSPRIASYVPAPNKTQCGSILARYSCQSRVEPLKNGVRTSSHITEPSILRPHFEKLVLEVLVLSRSIEVLGHFRTRITFSSRKAKTEPGRISSARIWATCWKMTRT